MAQELWWICQQSAIGFGGLRILDGVPAPAGAELNQPILLVVKSWGALSQGDGELRNCTGICTGIGDDAAKGMLLSNQQSSSHDQ